MLGRASEGPVAELMNSALTFLQPLLRGVCRTVPRHLTGRGGKDIHMAWCAGGWAASDFEGSGSTGLCERRLALEESVGIRLYLF